VHAPPDQRHCSADRYLLELLIAWKQRHRDGVDCCLVSPNNLCAQLMQLYGRVAWMPLSLPVRQLPACLPARPPVCVCLSVHFFSFYLCLLA
jgi:hypothetical protein